MLSKDIKRGISIVTEAALIAGTLSGSVFHSAKAEISIFDLDNSQTPPTNCANNLIINNHCAPFTKHEIEIYYGLDPLHSEACEINGSGKDCLAVWNRCNGNAQKLEHEKVDGCFDRFTTIKDQSGVIIGLIEELTSFSSETDKGQTLYTPLK